MKTSGSVSKKKLGSYPYFSVVFSISIALFVIGLLGLLLLHSQKLTRLIKENIEVQVYLTKDISTSKLNNLRLSFEQAEYVAKNKDGIPQLSFISKEEAASNFIAETGEDFASFLGENPLRDMFTLHIAEAYQSDKALEKLKSELSNRPGIFEIVYVNDLVDTINKNIRNITLVLSAFAALLIVVVIVLINNTIKLALFTQRFLIRSMQLVGATNSFIRKPFLLRSFAHGILSGLVACVALAAVMNYAYTNIEDLNLLKDVNQMYILFGVLLFLGGFLGFFGTLRSINKYLKLSLDELY